MRARLTSRLSFSFCQSSMHKFITTWNTTMGERKRPNGWNLGIIRKVTTNLVFPLLGGLSSCSLPGAHRDDDRQTQTLIYTDIDLKQTEINLT